MLASLGRPLIDISNPRQTRPNLLRLRQRGNWTLGL